MNLFSDSGVEDLNKVLKNVRPQVLKRLCLLFDYACRSTDELKEGRWMTIPLAQRVLKCSMRTAYDYVVVFNFIRKALDPCIAKALLEEETRKSRIERPFSYARSF